MTALHGFLGRPDDWDGVLGEEWARPGWLEAGFLAPKVADPDLFTTEDTENTEGESGARIRISFTMEDVESTEGRTGSPCTGSGRGVRAPYLENLAERLNSVAEGDTLLGYSMGGRIALHMLLDQPGRWKRAIIVSASPGPLSDEERASRLKGDEAWAGRFLHDEWDAVVRDWNAQAVFAHDPPEMFPRREAEFDRRALAAALALGSVARQADLRPRLRKLEIPILWVAGARDAKYAALAAGCAALNPLFSMTTLRTGHRAPWSDPDGFRRAVADFTTIRQ